MANHLMQLQAFHYTARDTMKQTIQHVTSVDTVVGTGEEVSYSAYLQPEHLTAPTIRAVIEGIDVGIEGMLVKATFPDQPELDALNKFFVMLGGQRLDIVDTYYHGGQEKGIDSEAIAGALVGVARALIEHRCDELNQLRRRITKFTRRRMLSRRGGPGQLPPA